MKVWLDNTPFKSNNTQLKRETLLAIVTAVMAIKISDMEALCSQLNDKLIITLTKYIFKAFELI